MTQARARGPKYQARRQDIVDTAARLFARNGYAETGIAEIGEAVDLARGALYYYIGSKEALLAEIHDRVLDPLLERSKLIMKLNASPAVKVRLISEVLLAQIIERQDHVWVFLHEYRALTGQPRKTFRAKREQFEQHLADLFAEGTVEGAFAIADLETTTLAFLGMHNYTYQWIRSRKTTPEALSEFYCSLFFRGILAGPEAPYKATELDEARMALAGLSGAPAQASPAVRPRRRDARR
jgi:TetR/AcrR family transcriptional regulator, cholesterol catabolism regulator